MVDFYGTLITGRESLTGTSMHSTMFDMPSTGANGGRPAATIAHHHADHHRLSVDLLGGQSRRMRTMRSTMGSVVSALSAVVLGDECPTGARGRDDGPHHSTTVNVADKWSKIVFPSLYAAFHALYWTAYIWWIRDED